MPDRAMAWSALSVGSMAFAAVLIQLARDWP
jgi:hypothetical protein